MSHLILRVEDTAPGEAWAEVMTWCGLKSRVLIGGQVSGESAYTYDVAHPQLCRDCARLQRSQQVEDDKERLRVAEYRRHAVTAMQAARTLHTARCLRGQAEFEPCTCRPPAVENAVQPPRLSSRGTNGGQ